MPHLISHTSTHKQAKRLGAMLSILLISGCMGEQQGPDQAPSIPCSAPEGMAFSDIESVTDWINALPKPTSLACFVESLPRPLKVNFTESVFSVQPSLGRQNPRTFVFYDKLILSFVPQHDSSKDKEGEPIVDLLELAYINNDIYNLAADEKAMTIKGEYKFPIHATIPYSTPYDDLAFKIGNISVCGVCHSDEQQVGEFNSIPVYQSEMHRPQPHLAVSLESLALENLTCDKEQEAFRCAMLSGLFDHGDLIQADFPPQARIF